MKANRLKALEIFAAKTMPLWGADLNSLDFQQFHYYLKPTDTEAKTWDQVPSEIKNTFERLKIPEAEREVLAGVKAQFDSEVT